MKFTDEQTSAVVDWLGQGRSLSRHQQALKVDYNLTLTYMELRFLVDDLEIPLVMMAQISDATSEEVSEAVLEPEPVLEQSGVHIDVDALVLPGLWSVEVSHFQMVKAWWQLAATGQLGLIPGG